MNILRASAIIEPGSSEPIAEAGSTTDGARTYALCNVRAVTADAVLEPARIDVVDGVIVDVTAGGAAGRAAGPNEIDGRGLLLVPGLVDSHSDGLEKEMKPRRTANFALGYAIAAFEGRLRSSGVTTVFHGIGYQDKPRIGRSVDTAREMTTAITRRGSSTARRVDHRLLYRIEARDAVAVGPLLADLGAGLLGPRPLVSFEDHTPGQGQYRDVERFAAAVAPEDVPDGLSLDDYVRQVIAEAERQAATRDLNLDRLSPLAHEGAIRMLAHDVESPDEVRAAHRAGAAIAEFPLTLEAARAARDLGMHVVMGAPNALRGSSHSGNASARELVAAGLCDVLASDYLPPAMLAGAFELVRDGCCSLVGAIGLLTSGPARLAGLDDRGSLAPGFRADLVLVDDRGTWPAVVGVRRADDAEDATVFG